MWNDQETDIEVIDDDTVETDELTTGSDSDESEQESGDELENYSKYIKDSKPSGQSMVYFRKRLDGELLQKTNEILFEEYQEALRKKKRKMRKKPEKMMNSSFFLELTGYIGYFFRNET